MSASTATTISTKEILQAPLGELRIHPDDYRELMTTFRYCWPGNAPRDTFHGVRLIQDVTAERLPRVAL